MTDKSYEEEHELTRKNLWISVYSSYVGCMNSTNTKGGIEWADNALKAYDDRFKKRRIRTTDN